MVFCCVPYCKSSSRNKTPGISFHEFPSKETLRDEWLKSISRDNFSVNDKSNSSVVCSKHFREEDFMKNLKRKRLLPNAIPSIFENYPSYMVPTSSSKRKYITKHPLAEKIVKRKRSYVDACDIPEINQKCDSPSPARKSFGNIIINKRMSEMRLLKSKLWKKNAEIENLKSKLKKSEEKVHYYEKNKYHSALEKLIILGEQENKKASFILNQIQNFFVGRPSWDEEILRECVLWFSCSPKGYNFVRDAKILTLPSKMTISRFIGPFTGELGITPLIKERLVEEANNLNDYERFCSLIIDEMAIKQNLQYDVKADSFYGFQTNCENQNSCQLANRLLCFLINGLSSNYRIPCGYFFPKQLTGKQLYELTLEVITELEKCGFVVIRIVTDNHKTNVAMFRMLGNGKLTHKISHPIDQDRFLFLSFDQNHIIKNIRSQFLEKDMAFGDAIISGKYVKLLQELQQNESIKPVRNLTKRHVEPSNIDKMNVGRAVLIFSPPVTAALSFLCKNSTRHPKAHLFKDASMTIKFMENIYKWFTVHDVSNCHQYVTSRNGDKKHFFSLSDDRLNWLDHEFLEFMKNIKKSSMERKMKYLSKETDEALFLTTVATTSCIRYLLDCGYHYVLTRAFNSDPIESLFSALRQMNGGNDVMDVRATLLSMEKILKTGQLITSKYSNVGPSDGKLSVTGVRILKGHLSMKAQPLASIPGNILQILDRLLVRQEIPSTNLKFASVAIVAGYLTKVIKENFECFSCLSSVESTHCDAPIFQLIAGQDRGGLTYPKPQFIQLISVILDFVEQIIPLMKSSGIVKTIYELIYPKLVNCPLWECQIDEHKLNIASLICVKFLPLVLKNMARNVTNESNSNTNKYSLSRKYLKFT